MILKMFIEEFKRHKIINITLLIFMMISAMLLSSATYVSLVLLNGVNELAETAKTPHYIQMHAGDIDLSALDDFNENIDYIESFQVQEMISINPNTIYIGDRDQSEINGVMDISFVTQNVFFDYLLNLDNEIDTVETGKIGVPVYYKEKYQLKIGDVIRLTIDETEYEFSIQSFVRDSQMNSALISSKRFLLSKDDFDMLSPLIQEREHLISYRFDNTSYIGTFQNEYKEANLPDNGPAIGHQLFKIMNALTDGIVVLILLLVSAALTVIGLLCLKYTLLSSLEEDIREIGVLKAIGLKNKKIKQLYFSKFVLLVTIAIFVGYFSSFALNSLFLQNIRKYFGNIDISPSHQIFPIFGALFVGVIVLFSVRKILKKINKVSIVQTITSQELDTKKQKKTRKIPKKHSWFIPYSMGIHHVKQNKKQYRLVTMIFVLSTLILILPFNVYNTFKSDQFIEYMGISYSDLRFDIRNTSDQDMIDRLLSDLNEDPNVEEYEVFKTYTMKAYNDDLEIENIFIEVGDYENFQIDYVEGSAPKNENEIAFSALSMQALDKELGDVVTVLRDDETIEYNITGVYQDITNGGKTAKAVSSDFEQELLWYVININVTNQSSVEQVKDSYSSSYNGIKITRVSEYLQQTLGDTIEQLGVVSKTSYMIAGVVTILISALFLNMILIKESKQIAIMKAIGLRQSNVTKQYVSRMLYISLVGYIIGILLIIIIGDDVISVVTRAFGAPSIQLVNNALVSFLLVPIGMLLITCWTSFIIIQKNKQTNIYRYINQ